MNKPTKRKTTAAKKTDSIAATKFRRSATIAGGYTFAREEDGQYVILNKDGSTLCTFPTERAVLDWIDERRREYWEKKKAEREAKSPTKTVNEPLRAQDALPPVLPTRAGESDAITMKEYGALEEAFAHLNRVLFDGKLPDAMFNHARKPHMFGHFVADRYSGRVVEFRKPEIALNPDSFIGRTDEQIISTLAHEMVHLCQQEFGKPGSRGYHNKEWAALMKAIGLMPSNTGAVGGKETGQQMDHYIIPGGAFARAFADLAATGWRLNLQSTIYAGGEKKPKRDKTKYTCPSCGLNLWGNIPDADISCNACQCAMPPERLVVAAAVGGSSLQSYDQQAAE